MSPEIAIGGLRDGSVARVDLFTQKVGNEGQLELSAIKPLNGQPATNWSFHLSVPDGGLIEENDEFPFEAPEAGYQSALDFQYQAGDTNWTGRVNKHFYIVFGQPPKYGRIDLETGINIGFYLGYAINPTGSRNLEPQ